MIWATAEWRHLAMLNYPVPPQLLVPLVPKGTELHLWENSATVSVLGLLFQNTKIAGWPVPGHQSYAQVNVRFYVRRRVGKTWREGVTFLREIAPKPRLAASARFLANEHYLALPTRHSIHFEPEGKSSRAVVEYGWASHERWHRIHMTTRGTPQPVDAWPWEKFISHRLWSYARQKWGGTMELPVEHPGWVFWESASALLEADFEGILPPPFPELLKGAPESAFLMKGSAVGIGVPRIIL